MMARKRKEGLSEPQKKVLEVLGFYQQRFGYPPSIREIQVRAGLSSTSVVNYYLDQLQERGLIERDNRVSRGIRLVNQALGDLLRIPLMGRIVASAPVPVPASDFNYFDAESNVEIARSQISSRERTNELFALQVQGDSMIDAMVNDGDIVIMKRSTEVHNGDMVAVWLNDRDETTLKYFYLENGRVRLQPANPTMNPIYIDDPSVVEIQGKVVMVIRQVEPPVQ